MFDIIISIQRIDTTKESAPMIMEFGGMVDIVQRFSMLVRAAITDKKDLFLVPTDYYKRETDAVAYIVGSDHSVYKVSIFEKKHDGPTVYKKVKLKDSVDEAQFSEYIYKLSYALAHSFTPSAFSTIPKKKCNCGNDHCDCHNHDDHTTPIDKPLNYTLSRSSGIKTYVTNRQEIDNIMEEESEYDSKFRAPFLKK